MVRTAHFVLLLCLIVPVIAQPPLGGGSDGGLKPIAPGSPEFESRKRVLCSDTFRTFAGFCNNKDSDIKKLYGSTNLPQFSYFNDASGDSSNPRGGGLRSARDISNILSKQTGDVFDERKLSEIATFIGQFIDHTLVATPLQPHEDTEAPVEDACAARDENLPIVIPPRDVISGFTRCLPFRRSARVRVEEQDVIVRPQNSLSSFLDLTNVYGPTKRRNSELRLSYDGLMKTSEGNLLPFNVKRLNNAPNSRKTKFYVAGDHRASEHPVLTSIHTLFLREHNRLAGVLKARNPSWNNDKLFAEAKKINEGQFQKIAFEEWFPRITGGSLAPYEGYKPDVNPTVSVSFSTAAFRAGHTLVGNTVSRLGPRNVDIGSRELALMFFNSDAIPDAGGIEPFLRGAICTRAQKVDLLVHDALRDNLFINVEGEESNNFDLIALNIQRSRDHNTASYNALRVKFGTPKATSFSDISSDPIVQNKLREAYGNPSHVEAWPGLMAEDHEPGLSFGRTCFRIWKREFERIRDGDRFYFRADNAFSSQVANVPEVIEMLRPAGETDIFRRILLDNTNISEDELPPKLFFANCPRGAPEPEL